MTHMNTSMKQKQTHRHREQTCGCQRGEQTGEERIVSLELADANRYRMHKQGSTTEHSELYSIPCDKP